MKYKSYTLNNFTDIPQLDLRLSDKEIRDIQVIANVLPFKVNNYVLDELIDWANIPNCKIFNLTFPNKGMLAQNDFNIVDGALENKEKFFFEDNDINEDEKRQLFPIPGPHGGVI